MKRNSPPGRRGGAAFDDRAYTEDLDDAVRRALDEPGFDARGHVAGLIIFHEAAHLGPPPRPGRSRYRKGADRPPSRVRPRRRTGRPGLTRQTWPTGAHTLGYVVS